MFAFLNEFKNQNNGDFFNYTVREWVDIGLACAIAVTLMAFVIIFFKKKKTILVFYGIILTLFVLSFIFKLYFVAISLAMIILMVGVVTLFFNRGPLHEALTLPVSNSKGVKGKGGEALIQYDEKKFFDDVETSIIKLSSTKTGAIMTFERSMDLTSYMKNGTIINAPFTPELVETIFYVGTRLHDGAIIVRKNIIVAASVYYTPSTKALKGKFGARHRAALGISESTDSITVICSEETGRISIAYNGNLESVRRDEFKTSFKEYMTK